MKVFLGLSDLCGYYSQLEQGLLSAGIDCVFVNAFPDREYRRTTAPPEAFGRLLETLGRIRYAAPRNSVRRQMWKVVQAIALLAYIPVALAKYDAFIFGSGESFLRGWDLPVLRLFGKTVIAVFHGTDARPPFLNAAIVGTEGDVDVAGTLAQTRRTKRFVRRVERYATFVINHALTAQFHEKPFINWLYIGIPYGAKAPDSSVAERPAGRTVIVHAPTRPGPKGTPLIERAVAALNERGHQIELVKLVGKTNAEVLQAIAGSDFVVDELYSDTTMASFATEAAIMGKTAIVGMYGYEDLLRHAPSEIIPPAFVCRPDGVEEAMETLVRDTERRTRMGSDALAFVQTRWSPREVALRFLRLLMNDVPPEWWTDPRTITYFHGWGLTEARLRTILSSLLRAAGPDAFCLADKPALVARMTGFAEQGDA